MKEFVVARRRRIERVLTRSNRCFAGRGQKYRAGIAQSVERDAASVEAASSKPAACSNKITNREAASVAARFSSW